MGTSDKSVDAIVSDLTAEAMGEALGAAEIYLSDAHGVDVDNPKMLVFLKMALAATRCALEICVNRQTSRLVEKEKT